MDQTNQPIVPPVRPKNWLLESILVTIFCCQIFGIVAIVFAAQVNSRYDSGDYDAAMRASKDAGKWTKIGFWIGIAWVLMWVLWIFFLGGLAFFSGQRHF